MADKVSPRIKDAARQAFLGVNFFSHKARERFQGTSWTETDADATFVPSSQKEKKRMRPSNSSHFSFLINIIDDVVMRSTIPFGEQI